MNFVIFYIAAVKELRLSVFLNRVPQFHPALRKALQDQAYLMTPMREVDPNYSLHDREIGVLTAMLHTLSKSYDISRLKSAS